MHCCLIHPQSAKNMHAYAMHAGVPACRDLSDNGLGGLVPEAWSALGASLGRCDLSGNGGLCGPLPSALRGASSTTGSLSGTNVHGHCQWQPNGG